MERMWSADEAFSVRLFEFFTLKYNTATIATGKVRDDFARQTNEMEEREREGSDRLRRLDSCWISWISFEDGSGVQSLG